MRTCMVAYAYYEEDTRIMRYAESLARRGDEVHILSLRRPGQCRKETVSGVNVTRIQTRPPNSGLKWSYLFGVMTFIFRTMFVLSWRHFRKPYKLIHIHSVPDFLVFSALLPKLTGAKLILDIHDMLPEFYASKFGVEESSLIFKVMLLVERASVGFVDHVIAANDLWYDKLIARCSRRTRCTCFVNVPDRAVFKREGRTRNDAKFIILYPGTLNWHQGLDLAVRAFHRIHERVPMAEFHIFGEGPSRAAIEELVVELGLKDRVKISGFVPTRMITRIIENADLGVVPKRGDGFGNEAFSTKIMEFMAMGVPVIVSDTRVDVHYFNESVVQFFRAGDVENLASCMLSLIEDQSRRAQMVKLATEFVENNDWNSMEPKYFELVDHLVKKSGPKLQKELASSTSVRP